MSPFSRPRVGAAIVLSLCVSRDAPSAERRIELGLQLAAPNFSQFEATDLGFGGRLSYRVTPSFAVEGEFNFFPANLTEEHPFSGQRTEGLFGVQVGPRFDRVGFFGRVRPGWVRFGEAPEPLVCILIFPPPLTCALAGGRTVFALDWGGGLEVFATERTMFRLDVGDHLLRYPGPVLSKGGVAHPGSAFWSHNLRIALGGGFRF